MLLPWSPFWLNRTLRVPCVISNGSPAMFILVLVFFTWVDADITRDYFGDIFRMKDCDVHRPTPCDTGGSRFALEVPGRPCYCQCAPSHFTYREDRAQCVRDIKECYMSVFYRPHTVESIPLVFLPTSGQLVHPDAHLSFAGRRKPSAPFPKCKAAISQYMAPDGWKTLSREGSHGGSIFGLFMDGNKTFLQFLGSARDRHFLQQHLVLIRMFCKLPEYAPFETCLALRVGWSPGLDPLELTSGSNSKTNMMVVGLSLGVLGLIYVLAVLIYLKIRRRMLCKRAAGIAEGKSHIGQRDIEKVSAVSRGDHSKRLEMYHTHSLGRRSSFGIGASSWGPNSSVEVYNRNWTDRPGMTGSEFQAQDFKLHPEFFEPEFLASPPKHVAEFLEKLQSSVSFARHRLRNCYRYRPTLIGIPEDDYFYQDHALEDCDMKFIDRIGKRSGPDGGSSSSVDEFSEAPIAPPRRTRTKRNSKYNNAVKVRPLDRPSDQRHFGGISVSEEEKMEIKNAMDTLNHTLEELELDIFRQDYENEKIVMEHSLLYPVSLNQEMSVEDHGRPSRNMVSESTYSTNASDNLMEDDFKGKDVETTLCSSVSEATVNSNNKKGFLPLRKCMDSSCSRESKSRQFSTFNKVPGDKQRIESSSVCGSMNGSVKNCITGSMKHTSSDDGFAEKDSCQNDINISFPTSQTPDESVGVERCLSRTSNTETLEDSSFNRNFNRKFNNLRKNVRETKRNQVQRFVKEDNSPRILKEESVNESQEKGVNCANLCKDKRLKNTSSHGKRHRKGEFSRGIPANEIRRIAEFLKANKLGDQELGNILNAVVNEMKAPEKSTSSDVASLSDASERTNSCGIKEDKHRNNSLDIERRMDNDMNIRDEGTETEFTEVTESESESKSNHSNIQKCMLAECDPHECSSTDTLKTDITQDSLDDSNCSSQEIEGANTPISLVDAWISRLSTSSVSHVRNVRKEKSPIDVDKWDHVCDKIQRDPCPVHENVSSLIDKLTQYGTKTMAGYDVSAYFHSLKQDVLRDHLKGWIAVAQQSKKQKLAASGKHHRKKESLHKIPLVKEGIDMDHPPEMQPHTPPDKIRCDSGFHSNWSSLKLPKNKRCKKSPIPRVNKQNAAIQDIDTSCILKHLIPDVVNDEVSEIPTNGCQDDRYTKQNDSLVSGYPQKIVSSDLL